MLFGTIYQALMSNVLRWNRESSAAAYIFISPGGFAENYLIRSPVTCKIWKLCTYSIQISHINLTLHLNNDLLMSARTNMVKLIFN